MVLIILGTILFSYGLTIFWSAFSLFSYFLFAVFAFFVFLVGILYPVDKRYGYQLFLFAGLVLVTLMINLVSVLGLGIDISLFLLMGYYLVTYWIKQRKMPSKESSIISVRRILAGERINKKYNIPKWKLQLHDRISEAPVRFERLLELPNLLLLVASLVYYFYMLIVHPEIHVDLYYRISLALFLGNVYLLKKIQYISNVSRFALALVVNFALYSALLKSGSGDIGGIIWILILWTFLCQVALFYLDRLKSRFMFSRKDYLYWTIVTCMASVVNVVLLFQVDLPGQFLFSLVFFYCGVELMILYYIFQFLNKEEEESIVFESKVKLEE